MCHVCEVRGSKWLSEHVRIVEFSVDLPRFDLAQCDLFLDVVKYHQEVLALLCIS